MTASSEFVTKRAPAVMPQESLESFWTISIWIMIVLNALALSAFLINLYIPKWPSLLQAGMLKALAFYKNERKTKVEDEGLHLAPVNAAVAAGAATIAAISDELQRPIQEPTEEKLDETPAPEKTTEIEAGTETTPEPAIEAPRSSVADLSEPKPSSPEDFEEKPAADLSELEASLNQALTATVETAPVEATAPTLEPAPEPAAKLAPEPAPEPTPEAVSDLTEPLPRPNFAKEAEAADSGQDAKKAPESKGLPEKTESGETKEEVKVNQSQNLDDLLSTPIEETDESLIFDSAALDFDAADDDFTGAS